MGDKKKSEKGGEDKKKKQSQDIAEEVAYHGSLYILERRSKSWKKRKFDIKGNQLIGYSKKKVRISFEISSLIINISSKKTRFEIDDGVNVAHFRTKTEKERDIWVHELTKAKNAHSQTAGGSFGNSFEDLDTKTESLEKTLNLAVSLETVLSSRIDILKISGDGETSKKKLKKSMKKSQNENKDSSLISDAREFHNTTKQIITTSESILTQVKELKTDLYKLKASLAEMKSGTKESADDQENGQPFIIHNYESDDSDSDMYFDPESADISSSDEDEEDSPTEPTVFIEPQTIKGVIDVSTIQKSYEKSMKLVPETFKPRKSLPGTKDTDNKASLWKLLKDSIGKDLSRVTVPIQFSEPTSMLQKMAEDLEYIELVHKAAEEESSIMRLIHIFGFAASSYASSIGRISKPFNPLLGETYEWCNMDKNFRFVSEQVSHHPPISACYVDSPSWILWSHIHVKNKFWGKSIEIIPAGPITLVIPRFGDHFVWNKVTSSINNLFMGQKSVDHFGDFTLVNHTTGEKIVADFKKKGWRGAGSHVKGTVYDAKGNKVYKISGRWSDELTAQVEDESEEPFVIWKRVIDENVTEEEFNLTTYAKQLNELPDWMEPYLPVTDARFRPDQKLLEEGDIETAADEKFRLEEKQRHAKKVRDENEVEYEPKWFKLVDKAWIFKGDYWDYRNTRKWPDDMPDIF